MESIANFLKSFQIPGGLPEEAVSKLTTSSIIWGIVALVLCVFVAFANKRGQAIGIITGILNFGSFALLPGYLEYWHKAEFYKKFYGTSQGDIDQQISAYYKEILPDLILYVLAAIVILAAFIFTIVFILNQKSKGPKVFGIIALILHILRYVAIAPYPMFDAILGDTVTVEAQLSQASTYSIFCVLPIILVAISTIIALATKKKAPVAEVATEAAPAAEAPAEKAAESDTAEG